MNKQNLSSQNKTGKVKREVDPTPRRYCVLTLIFGVIIVSGFLFAARQHFVAINLGMENSVLRKQRDELSTEQRRLKIAREVAYTPIELEKAAYRVGLHRETREERSNSILNIPTSRDALTAKADTKKSERRDSNPFDNVVTTTKSETSSTEKPHQLTAKDGSKKLAETEKASKEVKHDRRTETAARDTSDKVEKESKSSKL